MHNISCDRCKIAIFKVAEEVPGDWEQAPEFAQLIAYGDDEVQIRTAFYKNAITLGKSKFTDKPIIIAFAYYNEEPGKREWRMVLIESKTKFRCGNNIGGVVNA